jgi:hypothetical protein
MCGRDVVCERSTEGEAMEQIGRALHSLCQPLTTLQCRLELAELVCTMEAYRESVKHGLAECARLVEGVESMREILRASRQAEETSNRRIG